MSRTRTTRRLALVLAVLAAVTAVAATGGFSSVAADRGVSVAVVPDDRAYLGVAVNETDAADRRAISFVGFCTATDEEVDPEVTVTRYKPEADRANANREALAVAWETPTEVETVVLKTGGGATAIESFAGGTAGTAAVGDGTATTDLTAGDYCPAGEHEAGKVESEDLQVAPDASAGGVAVTVTNRFSEPLTTVRVTAGDATRTVTDLGVGESATVTFETCEEVAIAAEGDGVSVDLWRSCP